MIASGDEARARLRWQCRRGMLELDLLFEHFLATQFEQADSKTQTLFYELLTYADQDLFEYFFGHSRPDNKDIADVIERIRRAAAA
ncbi:MAG: succinate dehydrogenase assembly factor 2 [Gammaproteobacteria bacterium]|nr:succinate dehydrogenase assembly factor 2 [Gammaproteobacteria bacterium]